MTAPLQNLLERVQDAGAKLSVNGDKLRVETTAPMPPDLVEELRQAKPALLQHFAEAKPGGTIVALAIPPGCPAEWVMGVATLLAMRRPRAWPEALWPQLREDAFGFMRDHGATASELGWAVLDIFGACPRAPLRRLDAMGLVAILDGRAVVELRPEYAVILLDDGRHLNFTKPTAPGMGVLIWEL